VGDLVEPRGLELGHGAFGERLVHAEERALQRIFGFLARAHAAQAEAIELGAVLLEKPRGFALTAGIAGQTGEAFEDVGDE